MSRAWPVIKREFTEMVRTKAYLIGTILGPVIIAALFVLPILFIRSGGGGERSVLLLDATGTGIGREIGAAFDAAGEAAAGEARATTFRVEVHEVEGEAQAERRAARERIDADTDGITGFLYLPAGFVVGEATAIYEGRNATSLSQMEPFESVVTEAVRTRRLGDEGVDRQVLARVLAPVRLDKRKPGSDEEEGAVAELSIMIGYLMAFAVYIAVIMFAAAVMRGVLEEKRDRIVEVLLSSIKARQFIIGKVMGIGAASLLQMAVWVAFAAAAMKYGPDIAARMVGASAINLPAIPATVGVVFLFFFATGFLLYAAMFGAAGAIATSDQEANQLQFPVTVPLIVGIMFAYAVIADADSTMSLVGSLIPFTAPIVMPFRAMLTAVPTWQYLVAGVLMLLTLYGVIWAAAKIYRIGVLSTGKKPTMRELGRWLRTA